MILLNERGCLGSTELPLIALLHYNYTAILYNIKSFASICSSNIACFTDTISSCILFPIAPKLVCVTHTYHFSGKYFPVLVLHAVSFPFEETKMFQFYYVTFCLRSTVSLHLFVNISHIFLLFLLLTLNK